MCRPVNTGQPTTVSRVLPVLPVLGVLGVLSVPSVLPVLGVLRVLPESSDVNGSTPARRQACSSRSSFLRGRLTWPLAGRPSSEWCVWVAKTHTVDDSAPRQPHGALFWEMLGVLS